MFINKQTGRVTRTKFETYKLVDTVAVRERDRDRCVSDDLCRLYNKSLG